MHGLASTRGYRPECYLPNAWHAYVDFTTTKVEVNEACGREEGGAVRTTRALLTSTGLKLDTETYDKAIKEGSGAPGEQRGWDVRAAVRSPPIVRFKNLVALRGNPVHILHLRRCSLRMI